MKKTVILAAIALSMLSGCDGSSQQRSIWGPREGRGSPWGRPLERTCEMFGNCDSSQADTDPCSVYGTCDK